LNQLEGDIIIVIIIIIIIIIISAANFVCRDVDVFEVKNVRINSFL
jgi:hypothetical protein